MTTSRFHHESFDSSSLSEWFVETRGLLAQRLLVVMSNERKQRLQQVNPLSVERKHIDVVSRR